LTAAAARLSQRCQWRRRQRWWQLMVAATMASLPLPPMTATVTLALIILALALPWTRIGRQGGGRTVTCLICCCHSHCHWCHLCLHLWDAGTKDDSHCSRQGHHTNFHGQEDVEHHNPIGVEQKKKTHTKPSTVVAMSPPLQLQTATPMLPLLLLLCKQR
jgi:hypothetical protein